MLAATVELVVFHVFTLFWCFAAVGFPLFNMKPFSVKYFQCKWKEKWKNETRKMLSALNEIASVLKWMSNYIEIYIHFKYAAENEKKSFYTKATKYKSYFLHTSEFWCWCTSQPLLCWNGEKPRNFLIKFCHWVWVWGERLICIVHVLHLRIEFYKKNTKEREKRLHITYQPRFMFATLTHRTHAMQSKNKVRKRKKRTSHTMNFVWYTEYEEQKE